MIFTVQGYPVFKVTHTITDILVYSTWLVRLVNLLVYRDITFNAKTKTV